MSIKGGSTVVLHILWCAQGILLHILWFAQGILLHILWCAQGPALAKNDQHSLNEILKFLAV